MTDKFQANTGAKRNFYKNNYGRGGSWQNFRGRYPHWKRGRGRGNTSYGNASYGNAQPTFSSAVIADEIEDIAPVSSSMSRVIKSANSNIPYAGWNEYFPFEAYIPESPILKKLQLFQEYLLSRSNVISKEDVETRNFFVVDCKDLIEAVTTDLPDISNALKTTPETIISCLGLAMHQSLVDQVMQSNSSQFEINTAPNCKLQISKVYCRLVNYEPKTPLKQLRGHLFGKFVSVRGTVVRVSNIKPLCTQLAFECSKCSTVQVLSLPEGKFALPTKCSGEGCRSRTFHPKRNHSLTETIDWQTIRLQEMSTDEQHESGRIPRTIDCELTCDLVDCCVPGDIVTVCGIVKVVSSDEGSHSRSKDKCMYLLYILANSVTNNKGKQQASVADNSDGSVVNGATVDFSLKELYAIEAIQAEKNLFRLLVRSLCPMIYGHEMVKAGMVLALFGGSPRLTNNKNCIPVRGDIHVLVVGDPGLGKSQMLQALTNLAPRSVYVCGNTSTTSGLTVTLCKESGGGSGGNDYTLEAGALVLADQGCCCIDEFDKMGHHHQALLEAMEQQSISIAKAGIVCRLPARTSIIAAANPIGGHYNKGKTVSENLRMGSALLSRFDLVFILLDKPDEHMDSLLSEHVMALHSGKQRTSCSTPLSTLSQHSSSAAAQSLESSKLLVDRLKWSRNEPMDPIPAQLFRKYVAYSRRYVHPKITAAAASKIQEFYLELRRRHQTQDSTPITTRQLESLIRLTEVARARIELREEATEQDADDVIQIMKHSMIDTYTDEFGMLDFQRSQCGAGSSKQTQAKKFVAALHKASERNYNSLFTIQELKQIASEIHLQVRDFEDFLTALNTQDFLFKFLVIGSAGVGKSCILHQFIENKFKQDSSHTIGVEFGSKVVNVGGKSVKLQIWDTAGQERFRSVTRSYYRGAAGALLVYDITSRETYNALTNWLTDARTLASSNIVILLVGNKKDLEAEREVTFLEASRFAQENDLMFLETSAMTGENIEEAFLKCARSILTKIEAGEVDPERMGSGIQYGDASLRRLQRQQAQNRRTDCAC